MPEITFSFPESIESEVSSLLAHLAKEGLVRRDRKVIMIYPKVKKLSDLTPSGIEENKWRASSIGIWDPDDYTDEETKCPECEAVRPSNKMLNHFASKHPEVLRAGLRWAL